MENTRQPIPLRIRQHLRDAVGRMHPSVSFVSCIGVLLAYLTGVYITGSLHEASRWMGAMLACTSLVVVLQSHNYKDSLRAGWTRVLGTFLGALVAYIYLKIWPFSIVGMLASVFVLEMLCMLVGIYQNNRIATITLLIILLVSQMTPHVSPAVNCLLRFTESVVGVGVGVALLWVLERWKRWLEPQEHANIATDKNMNMDTMPLRWGHFRVLIVASLGQITGAGLATLVGVILPMIQIFRHPGLTSLQQGLVAATSLVGIMVGSVLFGAWSDKKGYLFFFRFCPALILAASLFTFFTADLFGLVTGLFFMGLGIGGGYSLDSDYISEIMPRRWKLLMVGVAKAASSLGSIAAAAICFSLLREWHDPHLWNRLLLLVAVMAVVMLLCRIRFEQSPGWLIAHGRISEAEKAVRYFLGPDVEIGEIRNRPNKTQMPKVAWSDLFKPGQVKKVIFSGIPWACEGLGVYGIRYDQHEANRLSTLDNLIILCGHYKGIDYRIREHLVTREISIGDYVLTGGELAACIIADSVIRIIPGAIGDEASALTDCFQDNLLAPPVYTRPAEFNGWKVPDVLLSGNFARIDRWKEEQAWERTKRLRPDLLKEE